jgi:2,3-bisphosphoglycerate-independent phosphoglycerate mutase
MALVKPFVLIILDGFGYREQTNHNAIAAAKTPHWDKLWQEQPHMLIEGSGAYVGLPDGQMGNSEVGHLNLGAGRIVPQDFTRIQKSINDGSFNENPAFTQAIDDAIKHNKKIHILGLLSAGGVHSHEDHIFALMKLAAARGSKQVYLHAFLDGRDTPPKSAEGSIKKAEALFAELDCGHIASIIGRYFAMDRDNRWDRIEKTWNLLTKANAVLHANTAVEALKQAYIRGETDEFVEAASIHPAGSPSVTIEDGDCVIFMNYRADRARQLTRVFTRADFSEFDVAGKPNVANFISLTQYAKDLPTTAAFGPNHPKNTLGECIARQGLSQLRIAETEKYAHVTFFFNGGREQPFELESRELIASPKVATYDLQPEMSAELLTDELVKAIESQHYSLIICNYANPDMVGHTGNFAATVKAIECIDACLARVTTALNKVNGQAIITADHGNAEYMYNHDTGQAHTAHTCEPVPLVYIGSSATIIAKSGALCDIAPTILSLMKLPVPAEMSRNLLIVHEKS